jgi:hypothetical protein
MLYRLHEFWRKKKPQVHLLLAMKSNLNYLARLLLVTFISLQACNTPDSEPSPVSGKGTPTEAGKAIGAPTTKTIGISGGSISTSDGKLTLTFPDGALEKETSITIQPVENKAINGVGIGYEFTPHGTKFDKPVTFTYHYTPEELLGATPDAMGLATQHEDGTWMAERLVKVDQVAKTITGKLDHFSWWSIFSAYSLNPETAVVAPGTWVDLKITEAIEYPNVSKEDPDYKLLVYLNETLIAPSQIKKISLNGNSNYSDILASNYHDGYLGIDFKAKGAIIRYTAPAAIPENNPVALGVELALPSKALFMLVGNVTVQNENSFVIKGKHFNDVLVNATIREDGFMLSMLDRVNPQEMASIYMTTKLMKEGFASFEPDETDVMAAMEGGKVDGQSAYHDKCLGYRANGGTVTIKKIFEHNGQKFIEGTISGTCTQYYANNRFDCGIAEHKTFEVSARFKTPLR